MATKLKIIIILLSTVTILLVVSQMLGTDNTSENPIESTDSSNITVVLEDNGQSSGTMKTSSTENNDTKFSENNATDETNPVIVYLQVVSGNLEIRSYVPVVDKGGKCTAVLTHLESKRISVYENNSMVNASTTDCEMFTIPVSQLDSGTTSVVVSYSSDKYNGSSLSSEVVIP